MGRTVPSFLMAEMQEVGEWRAFRKSLPKREREVFDQMLDTARLYISASSFSVRTSRLEGMGMTLLFHHYKQLQHLSDRLEREER